MSKIKGTKTEKNLLKAFAGESQARNRYYFFADKAHEEGYEHIAAIFRETGDQEMVHALQFFRYLDGGGSPLEITAAYPAGTILTTEKNLEAAAGGEHEEWSELYPEFAKIAKEEGFTDVFRTFNAIAISEKQHEKRYLGFLEHLKAGDLFKRDGKIVWRCRKCGYISEAPEAPGVCPACKHPQSWFEILSENW
jgi:rubrerythrin